MKVLSFLEGHKLAMTTIAPGPPLFLSSSQTVSSILLKSAASWLEYFVGSRGTVTRLKARSRGGMLRADSDTSALAPCAKDTWFGWDDMPRSSNVRTYTVATI